MCNNTLPDAIGQAPSEAQRFVQKADWHAELARVHDTAWWIGMATLM